MPTIRSSGSNPHSSSARGESISGGVDQNVAMPCAVAPSSSVWIAAATASRFSSWIVGLASRCAADDQHVGRAGVLGARLAALDVVAEVALDHVVDERLAEPRRASPVNEANRHGHVCLWLGAQVASSHSWSIVSLRHLAVAVDQHVRAA